MTAYKLVPVEPTDEMVVRGAKDIRDTLRMFCIEILDDLHNATEFEQYFAESCFNAMVADAPAVEQEAWSGWGCQYPGKLPRLYGDRSIAELNCDHGNGDQLLYFAAAPEAPEVAQLVEALECALETMGNVDGANDCSRGIDAAEEALAAYRNGREV